MEFIFMCVLTAFLWLFLVCPCFLGIAFDYSPNKYIDAVKVSFFFSLVIVFIIAIAICLVLVIDFISGDATPVTTLIERLKT